MSTFLQPIFRDRPGGAFSSSPTITVRFRPVLPSTRLSAVTSYVVPNLGPCRAAHPHRHPDRNGFQYPYFAGNGLLYGGYASGVRDITTDSQAAEALRPIAGEFAFAMFAVGIIGTGMLAVPVLAGSAAYAVTEMAGLAGSLDAKPLSAKLFYATIAATTLAGASLDAAGIDPARALYWAAVVNGILAGAADGHDDTDRR